MVTTWMSKGLLDKSIKPPAASVNILNPTLDYFNKPRFQIKLRDIV